MINTNVLSLNAQRNLAKSGSDLATALERLSSGLRINSAGDDAAGLAISDRLTAQIRGSNQAARNASDAISLAQTGEGGLQEITNNLQRARELAVQARNATNTDSDRQSIDAEFQQLVAEIDRVAKDTSFNGRNVLDGSLGSAVFQVGANVGETIAVDFSTSVRTNSIGQLSSVTYKLDNDNTATVDGAGEITIGTTSVAAAVNGSNGLSDGSAERIADAINASSTTHGVTASASTATATYTAAQVSAFAFTDNATNGDTLTYTLSINGTQVFTQGEADTNKTSSDIVGLVNAVSSTTGVTATLNSDDSIELNTKDGRNIELGETLGGANDGANDTVVGYFGNTLTGAAASNTDTSKGSLTLTSDKQFSIAVDITGTNELFDTSVGSPPADGGGAATVNVSALESANVLTANAADAAIQRLDQAINDVDVFRGKFGATINRFESTVANLQTSVENSSAARSRIRDADFAAETTELTRTQILQQAGTSVLSQANSNPQQILSLLQ